MQGVSSRSLVDACNLMHASYQWRGVFVWHSREVQKRASHSSTPHCTSIQGLMVSIRWYLAYLKAYSSRVLVLLDV